MLTGLCSFHLGLSYPIGGALVAAARIEPQLTQFLFNLLRPEACQTILTYDVDEICTETLNQRIPAFATSEATSEACLLDAPRRRPIHLGKPLHDALRFNSNVMISTGHMRLLPIKFYVLRNCMFNEEAEPPPTLPPG